MSASHSHTHWQAPQADTQSQSLPKGTRPFPIEKKKLEDFYFSIK